MSKSGQEFVAATQGSQFTMYAVMKMLGIPLSIEQQRRQEYLEKKYPAIVEEEDGYTRFDAPTAGKVGGEHTST